MADLEAILAQAKNRDETAFAGLVRNYQSMVYSIALHFFGNAAWAEEIAQEVFLELHRGIGELVSVDHLCAWLRRTAMCRCIDLSRKRNYRAEVPLDDSFVHRAPTPERDVFAEDWIREQVAELPENQRAVIILRYQEDLEPMEIAGLLALPVNTVKSRLHRALERLRERLQATSAKGVRHAV